MKLNLQVLKNSESREVIGESILRTNEHIDGGWFWNKYSASPYRGCQFGCSYCFLRQNSYGLSSRETSTNKLDDPFKDIREVVINSPDVLDRELADKQRDIIITGDYQPIDKKYELSRRMLEVCLNRGFPTVVITRSPLIVKDIDLLKKFNDGVGLTVVFSAGHYQSEGYLEFFEPSAPSIESRFSAMKRLSAEGICTGLAAIPILPFVSDSDSDLERLVTITKSNGGSFIMAGGIVLDEKQKLEFYRVLKKLDASLPDKYRELYGKEFSPEDDSWARLGRKVRDLCVQAGIGYRMKRMIVSDSPLKINKLISERLFVACYNAEIDNPENQGLARGLRKIAFKVDEANVPLPKDEQRLIEQFLISGDLVGLTADFSNRNV